MWAYPWSEDATIITNKRKIEADVCHAAIPLPTTRAKRLVKFANMTDEEKRQRIILALVENARNHGTFGGASRTILQSLGLIGGGK